MQVQAWDAEQLGAMAKGWLKELIRIPSLSGDEAKSAGYIAAELEKLGVHIIRCGNNILAWNRHRDPAKKTLVLNSHHDTVKPGLSWTKKPYLPVEEEGKIYGLGSNDAGASLVSLMAVFIHFYEAVLPVNLLFIASAEEERSGTGGIASVLPLIENPDLAIVGEPTGMNLAVAEKGLLVLDVQVKGKSGHAAREEGENAIYKAIEEVRWFKNFCFPKRSDLLGDVKMSVTGIRAGELHNMVPDACSYTVDIRVTEVYSHEEILEIIRENISSEIHARSTRLRSSRAPSDHPLVLAASGLGMTFYGSPTLSDQALLPFHSVKIGPGASERSHTADEFIYTKEIETAITTYIRWINKAYL
jgi:acetylornithine deacetylase